MLKSVDFHTVSCSASNHKHAELLSIFVHYLQGYSLEPPIDNKILTLAEISGETVDIISAQIVRPVAS
jgi:hypothetical protein